ncbi:MAG: hypothetical protein OXU45_02615 [Candidatus Melainabacteria bacterium]|nr:hypothetical protein [Candidatus Melainabacteria bacterium]
MRLDNFTRSITRSPDNSILNARLGNVRYEEAIKRWEAGREMMTYIRQSHDAISLAEDNKHMGQAATELAKS